MRMQREIKGKMAAIGLALGLALWSAGPALADLMTETEEPFVAGAGIYQPRYTPQSAGDKDRAAQERSKSTEMPTVDSPGIHQPGNAPAPDRAGSTGAT